MKVILILLMLIAALIGGAFFTKFEASGDSAENLANLNHLQSTARKEKFVISTISIGSIKPKTGAEVKVGSQVSGIVSELKVRIGQRVEKGALLAKIDSALLNQIYISNREEANSLRHELKFSKLQFERRKNKSIFSQEEIELAEKNMQVLDAQLKQAEAKTRESEILLRYTEIVAPLAGTISSISTYEGETVAASLAAPTFVNIIDLERQEVQTYVDETDIGSVEIGQKVLIKLESFPESEVEGVVNAINPTPQIVNEVVNYIVLIDFDNSENLKIRPEMTAQVHFIKAEREAALVVASKAILRESGNYYLIKKVDDEWRKVFVEVGIKESGRMEVVSGLSEGDTYLSDKKAWLKLIEGNPND